MFHIDVTTGDIRELRTGTEDDDDNTSKIITLITEDKEHVDT